METSLVLGVVLAGGSSSRMGGIDKPEIIFEGQSLVARAVAKLSPQVSEVCISSSKNYGLDCVNVPDIANNSQGPLAGVYAALAWVIEQRPHVKAILTVPVDAPFYPNNLAELLVPIALATEKPVLAETNDGLQPTFACWPISVYGELDTHMNKGDAGALQFFAKKMGAANIMFDDPQQFYNINSQDDLDKLL